MNRGGKHKIIIKRLIICIFLCCIFIILTVPLHEAAHWVLSEFDPYSKPTELHLLNFKLSNNKQNLLFSPLGYVKIKEAYPGSFKDRPIWFDPAQELICALLQIFFTCIIVSKFLRFFINTNFI